MSHPNPIIEPMIDIDNDDILWNGLTKEETDNSMSVKGLKENPDNKVWSTISPKHYKDIVPGYEYMDIMEHVLGYNGVIAHLRGQIFKYLMRFGKKDYIRLEAGKVEWYAQRLVDVIERYDRNDGSFPCKPKRKM
jgi:hypothetical protein